MLKISSPDFSSQWPNLSAEQIARYTTFEGRLERPWQIFSFEDRPQLSLECFAVERRLNGLQLARDLQSAEGSLKKLLVAPLIGSVSGVGNTHIHSETIDSISACSELIKLGPVSNFIRAAQEESTGKGVGHVQFTNDNCMKFLLLRQNLEDMLIDVGVASRHYNVRPKYQFELGQTPRITDFAINDTLSFQLQSAHLQMKAIGGSTALHAAKCPLIAVEIDKSDSSISNKNGAHLLPKYVALGLFDTRCETIEPQSLAGKEIERQLFAIRRSVPVPQQLYFFAWEVETQKTADIQMAIIPTSSISISPEDPSELAILKALQRREANLVENLMYIPDQTTVLVEGGDRIRSVEMKAQRPAGQLCRLESAPFFEERYFYGQATPVARELTVQDWVKKLGALIEPG